MKRRLVAWAVLVLSALYVIGSARLFQSAVSTVDSGTRPLGQSGYTVPSGPVFMENDSYYWLAMAEQMSESGNLRIRWTSGDNFPEGRPVYWSQSIAWLILAGSKLGFDSTWTPAHASVWVNPAIQVGTILLLFFILQPFGHLFVSLFLLVFVSLGDIAWAYQTLRPDHQSLQASFLLLTLACLMRCGFGFVSAADSEGCGRGWFAVAGAFAGLGCWVSAAAMMPSLTLLTVSVCSFAVFAAGSASGTCPKGWLVWGTTAAAVSLVMWVVEFWPQWHVLRLEFNSPVFALWLLVLGFGIWSAVISVTATGKRRAVFLSALVACGFVAALLPAAIFFGPSELYLPRNVFMDRLHNFIMEFYTFANFTKGRVLENLVGTFQLFLPLAALIAWPAFAAPSRPTRAVAFVLLFVTLGLGAMSLRQIRWFALMAPVFALSVCFATAWIATDLAQRSRRWKWVAVTLVIVVVGQSIFFAYSQTQKTLDVVRGRSILNEFVTPVLNKRVAVGIAEMKKKPTGIMGDPNMVPAIYYFSRIPGVVSFYWENTAGTEAAMLFFADQEGRIARDIARRRGFSHVILPSGHLFPNYFEFIKNGAFDRHAARNNLASALGDKGPMPIPEWLEVDYELNRILQMPFTYRGETLEQFLNGYRVLGDRLDAER